MFEFLDLVHSYPEVAVDQEDPEAWEAQVEVEDRVVAEELLSSEVGEVQEVQGVGEVEVGLLLIQLEYHLSD